ncbi:Serine/threonine-protein kinase SRPK [Tetrabaena socialis]|uniref:non-specific serine/threonine protein kinase n=1 Tax=Tetrabaena socialis TaxID=47790 RepID=A0A2J7ZTQ4_9CHLO|nr:Serine/threonine-protein kinase SRPK [Tetrabaena socialis]|eukprot:PNH03655.1 Serine/threonine-protein kinase SRPK [Tetrabaena socialis]
MLKGMSRIGGPGAARVKTMLSNANPAGGAKIPIQVQKRRKARKKAPEQRTEKPQTEDSSYSSGEEDYSDSEDEGTEDYKKGGYHPVSVGDKYKSGRYTVLKKLGWGHFSTVWLVHDAESGEYRALKIQKSAQHYTEAARDEITLLTQLAEGDASNSKHCVRLYDSFEHTGPHGRHVCLVFEVLGDNLLALIKRYDYKGIPIPIVRNLARQMLVYEKGKYARDYFNRNGDLRHIKKLRFWPLDRVLVEKYKLSEGEAAGLASFLLPMLRFAPDDRATAAEMLAHPWLRGELSPRAQEDTQQADTAARSDRRGGSSASGASSRSPSADSRSERERSERGAEEPDAERRRGGGPASDAGGGEREERERGGERRVVSRYTPGAGAARGGGSGRDRGAESDRSGRGGLERRRGSERERSSRSRSRSRSRSHEPPARYARDAGGGEDRARRYREGDRGWQHREHRGSRSREREGGRGPGGAGRY